MLASTEVCALWVLLAFIVTTVVDSVVPVAIYLCRMPDKRLMKTIMLGISKR